MADNEIKIKVIVDDSQEKKYYSESESRKKQASNKDNQEEIRKTAFYKAELDKKYALLKSSLDKELQAQKSGDELKIKQAVKERIAKTRELNLYEIEVKKTNRLLVEDTKQAHRLEILSYKNKIKEMSSAPRTNLRGTIGSEAYVRQLQSARTTMLPTSPEFAQTTALINRYKDTLKQSGIEVKSLAQNIRGELTSALTGQAAALMGVYGAQQLFNLSLDSARFKVLRDNFQGTTQDLEMFRKATSGTVDDASLIRLSNQATDLGINLKDQAILFSLAEDASDKYGISVEEGFQKVVFATEGGTKGLKNIGIQKAVYEEIVKSLTEAYIREGKQIDAETEKQIKLQAVIQASGKSYEDVTNKVQDSADKHEQFLVVAKNLGLYYGGDFFNAVTGVGTAYKLLTEGVDLLSKGLEIQKGIIMSSVSAWQNLTSQIPIVGDAISWLADRYRDLAGAQSQTAEKTFVDAGADFIEAFDPNGVPTKTRSGSNANVLKKSGTGSNSSKTETQKEVLNLIELEQQKLAKLNTQLQANLGDIGSELQLRREILAVELEIFRLRTGQRIDMGKALEGKNSMALTNAGILPRTPFKNLRALNDPRGDMLTDELNGIELSFNDIKSTADSIVTPFQNILGLAGLTESEFGKMLQMIQGLFNAGSSVFDIFSTVLSFFPGGSIVGGALSGGGAGGAFSSGMPRGINFNPTIIMESEVEKNKVTKLYQNTLPEYNRRQAMKGL